MTAAVAATAAVGLGRWFDMSPEEIRNIMIDAARDKVAAPPCFWYDVVVIMGKTAKKKLGTSVPECVIGEAIRRITLGVIDKNKPNWISLDNVKLLIMRYVEKHKCKRNDGEEAAVAHHARILSGYVREWVRLLADGGAAGSLEHMTLSQAVLASYLSSLRYC